MCFLLATLPACVSKQDKIDTLAKEIVTKAYNGDTDAMTTIGYIFSKKGDAITAHKWYKKAADLGNAEAKYKLKELPQ